VNSDQALKDRIEVGLAAVQAQVAVFERLFGTVDSEWKADQSRVTEADLTISRELETYVLKAFPEDQFFSEETQQSDGAQPITSEFIWITDPVDGTNNFALGMSMCAISLGLLHNGVPVYGFIYDASRKCILQGGKGLGAFDGDKPMQPSPRGNEDELYVAFDGYNSNRLIEFQSALLDDIFKMRNLGSGTLHLAYTANNLLDGSLTNRVNVWDIAAAYAICEEVGVEFHFLNGSIFPMKAFDVKAPKIIYYAGTGAFCRKAESMWKEAGLLA